MFLYETAIPVAWEENSPQRAWDVPLFHGKEPIPECPWWRRDGFLASFVILSWFDKASAEQMLSQAGSWFVYSQPPVFFPPFFVKWCFKLIPPSDSSAGLSLFSLHGAMKQHLGFPREQMPRVIHGGGQNQDGVHQPEAHLPFPVTKDSLTLECKASF